MKNSIGILVTLLLLCNPFEIKATECDDVISVEENDEKVVAASDVAREVPYYDITKCGGTWDGTYYYLPDGKLATECFFCDGTYTYYLQNDGTPMKNRLTYHPDGEHIIYFDEDGHEAFDSIEHIEMSIAGDVVDDYCYFGSYGYMYIDEIAFCEGRTIPSYFNAYGVMENNGWFQFADGNFGFASVEGLLVNNQFGYNSYGQIVFYHWNGTVARGIIEDDNFYYYMNEADGHLEGIQKKTDAPYDAISLTTPAYIPTDAYDMSVLGDNFLTQGVKDNNFTKYMQSKYSPFEDWSLWIYPDSEGNVINSENHKAELFITNRGIMVGSTKEDVHKAYVRDDKNVSEYSVIDGKVTYGYLSSKYEDIEHLQPGVANVLKKAVSYEEIGCDMTMTDRYPPAPLHLYDIDGIRFFYDSNDTVIMIEYFRYAMGNHYIWP